MRLPAAVLLFATAGSAGASSLTVLEPMDDHFGPSMVALADAESYRASRSMVALGEAVPAVSHEKLSAIGKEPSTRDRPTEPLLVIRGGLADTTAD
jgi:hypothetical protein